MTDISRTIESFIVDEILMDKEKTRIDPEASLINSGIVDSLSLLRLIQFVEEEFGVIVEDEEVVPDNFDTLNTMESFVGEKLKNKQTTV